MADGGLTLQIDEALADSLRARADAAGQSVEEYALLRLSGTPWEQVQARLRNFGQPR